MNDKHADSRDSKRSKRRYGMRVNNKAAHLHQLIINKRADEARKQLSK